MGLCMSRRSQAPAETLQDSDATNKSSDPAPEPETPATADDSSATPPPPEPNGSSSPRRPLPPIVPGRKSVQRGNLNFNGPSSQQLEALLHDDLKASGGLADPPPAAPATPLNVGDLLPPSQPRLSVPTKQQLSPADHLRAARLATQRSELETLCDELLAIAHAVEPGLTETMTQTAAATTGTLEGLEYRFKGRESLLRKATADFLEERQKFFESLAGRCDKNPKSMEEVVFLISDSLRYTITFSTQQYVLGTKNSLKRLKQAGFKALKCKNYWEPNDSYQGINAVLGHSVDESRGAKKPRLFRVEVQFHTPESFAVKMDTHRLYELYRVEGDPIKKAQLYQQLVAVADSPPMPPGVLDIRQLTSKPPPEMYKVWLMQLEDTAARNEMAITQALEAAVGLSLLQYSDSGGWRSVSSGGGGSSGSSRPSSRASGTLLLATSTSTVSTAHSAAGWRLRQSLRRSGSVASTSVGLRGRSSRRQRMEQAMASLESVLSYTIVFPEPVYWTKVTETVTRLEEQGLRQVDYENYWLPQPGIPWMYRGYHVLFQMQSAGDSVAAAGSNSSSSNSNGSSGGNPGGGAGRFELQFHTPESYEIKQNGLDEKFHEYRSLSGRERTSVNVQLMKIWHDAFVPRGAMHKGRKALQEPREPKPAAAAGAKPASRKNSKTRLVSKASLGNMAGQSPEDLRKRLAKPSANSEQSLSDSETLVEEIRDNVS